MAQQNVEPGLVAPVADDGDTPRGFDATGRMGNCRGSRGQAGGRWACPTLSSMPSYKALIDSIVFKLMTNCGMAGRVAAEQASP
ncbi:hypothetical protein [uncultured Hoeflea sp.]|uniref:hypothetical protein n=1 Tax=uncultured Hoeflea sp. TaxID=538666 RepID=UPI0030DAFDAC